MKPSTTLTHFKIEIYQLAAALVEANSRKKKKRENNQNWPICTKYEKACTYEIKGWSFCLKA